MEDEYVTLRYICPGCGEKKQLGVQPREHTDAWNFCLTCSAENHFTVIEKGNEFILKLKEI